MKKNEPDADPCGCGGKPLSTNQPLVRLVEIVTRAEMLAKLEAKSQEEQRAKDADNNNQNEEGK